MTTSSLLVLLALGIDPSFSAEPTLYRPQDPGKILFRGQTPHVAPLHPPPAVPLGTVSPWNTHPTQLAQRGFVDDPFLDQPGITPYNGGAPGTGPYGTSPLYDQFGGRVGITGINGPQPYRYGWKPRLDVGYLPSEGVSRGQGEFSIFEADAELKSTRPLSNGSIFSHAPQFGLRTWETPVLVGGENLPSTVYRLGWDFEWATPANGPWSMSLGFNPSLNTDFERTPGSDAWNYDARALLFHRASAQWMYVLGVGYLDRVNDRLLPYAGVVWTPDDRTELRLMFPESRLSYYLGNYFNDDKWIYASAGFHVEAYEVELQQASASRGEKIELSDWRAVIGIRSEHDYLSTFIEGGIVFDRQVEFLHETPGFDISNGFILRGGLRF